ncbi:MAG TPA: hypothetical protein PLO61_01325 [Fimbriimonadaceae bacterium]|nr:hypothetical protein [Fimbriimonadaceae bacterium]HRJ32169.1 hypothetical protein [Fimbriimonadaceae bacterium]
METLIQNLVEKVGLDAATADKVGQFIQEHLSDIPGWIAQSGIADKLPGGLGDMLGNALGGDKPGS